MRFSFDMGVGENSNCGINIMRVGVEHCAPKKGPVDGVRPSYSLHLVLFGRGKLQVGEERSYMINRGQMFLLYKGEKYSYYPDPSDPWSYLWVDFTGEDVEALFSLCGFSKENCFITLNNFEDYIRLMQNMHSAFRASEMQKTRCIAYFLLIVSNLIEQAQENKIPLKERQSKKIVLDVVAYLSNNFNQALTNEMIAKESGVSLRTLTEFFVKIIDMTPMQYLTSYRISIACERFQHTDMSVKEVAAWTGYDDEKYFSRTFHKEKGMSPQDYKKAKPSEDPFAWCRKIGGGFILE